MRVANLRGISPTVRAPRRDVGALPDGRASAPHRDMIGTNIKSPPVRNEKLAQAHSLHG
jgi:hypothetical protein